MMAVLQAVLKLLSFTGALLNKGGINPIELTISLTEH